MKKSELRKLIREVIKEQPFNPRECVDFLSFPWTENPGNFNSADDFCNRCEVAYLSTQEWAVYNGAPDCHCCTMPPYTDRKSKYIKNNQ